VTIRDVALAAGVSKTTAVCVLNNTPHFNVPEQTRQRVRDAARNLGYRRNAIASALSRGRLYTIGVVCPIYGHSDQPSLYTTYTRSMIVAISEAAHRVGLRSTLVPLIEAKPINLAEVSDGRIDGVILFQVHDAALVKALYETGLPCVGITAEHCPRSVRPDNRGGAWQAVEYLVSLGHRRIAHCANENGEAARERRSGFIDAVRAMGLNPEECPVVLRGEQVTQLLAQPAEERPTAFFTFNDSLAVEVLHAANQQGIPVPCQLSIVGFDNDILAVATYPQLTTIHNPMRELAEKAVQILQTLWNNEEPLSFPPVPTRLVIRASSAPPFKEEL
jgi:LacI family transcriptional regulator